MLATCPLLGRETEIERTEYRDGRFELVRCLETGFVFLKDPPTYGELRDAFPWEETTVAERRRRSEAEPLVARMSAAAKWAKGRVFPRRNRMYTLAAEALRSTPADRELTAVDIGCGWGYHAADCCERFASDGRTVRPVGIELSPVLADSAADLLRPLGGRVLTADAVGGVAELDDRSIDLAMMTSFLEHEPHPLELLRALRPKFAPGGAVVLKVPNFASLNRRLRGRRWCGFRYPDHVNYFTPRTLRLLADEAGYEPQRDSWTLRPPLSDNMYAVLRPAQGAAS